MEPQYCFSIPYMIIMNNSNVVIIFLVINSSILISQGSVSGILTLVYACCGICKKKARMYLHILPFKSVFDIGLPSFMP